MNVENKQIQKVIDILKIGGNSDNTIENYVSAINRFIAYFHDKDIAKLNEDDILEYVKRNFLDKSRAGSTYNLNICAIKYFYAINFNKQFNNKLLPRAKTTKKIPTTIDHATFISIFNKEQSLQHKCWLLLAYSSGLRVSEIATLKIENIISKEHTLKVLGKRKKERLTVLTDVTIDLLRTFYKTTSHYYEKNKIGFLFKGYRGSEHINSGSISNYFTDLKAKYDLDDNITFHSLRHSFATNFIRNGGEQFTLKSMLGHSSLNTTSIYVHMGRDFNNLKGVSYDRI